jgi:hypothetical protein
MVAGFWAWLFAPAAPQATTVAAPRLHVEAVQIDATEQGEDPVEYAEHAQTAAGHSAPSEPDTAPRISAGEAPLSGTTPVAAGPRAPPAAS